VHIYRQYVIYIMLYYIYATTYYLLQCISGGARRRRSAPWPFLVSASLFRGHSINWDHWETRLTARLRNCNHSKRLASPWSKMLVLLRPRRASARIRRPSPPSPSPCVRPTGVAKHLIIYIYIYILSVLLCASAHWQDIALAKKRV